MIDRREGCAAPVEWAAHRYAEDYGCRPPRAWADLTQERPRDAPYGLMDRIFEYRAVVAVHELRGRLAKADGAEATRLSQELERHPALELFFEAARASMGV